MTTAAHQPARLQQHIEALRTEIASSEAKRQRIADAITKKRTILNRLEAQAALNGPVAPARKTHDCL